ncbi:MAG TPA: RNA polymerase factor sigma-32 [Syntrophorhabdaceae bacterium]|jgi:RNA polymerase sigma-32 factor
MTDERFSEESRNSNIPKEDSNLPVTFDPLKTYLSEISKYPVMAREEEYEISVLMFENQDQDAAQALVTANLRLVVKIALEYYSTYLNLLDLIQEGNIGILRAVKKYNPYKGTKFSSYASFWIRAYILKYIMDSWSMVKVGTTQGQRKLFFNLKKESSRLEALGISPDSSVIAISLEVKEKEVEEMKQRIACGDLSLETPSHDEGDDTIMDTLRSDDDILEIVSRKEETEMLSIKIVAFRKTLNYRAVFILDHRIITEDPKTLQQIGTIFNISRERVRQVENNLRKSLKEYFTAPLLGVTS